MTILSGTIDTEDILADERVVDMEDEITFLDPDTTQFTTILMKLGSKEAIREKVNWLEDDLFPRLVTLSASATSAATSIGVGTGESANVRVHDVLRNMSTGEAYRVTGVSADSAIGIERALGGVAAASSATAMKLLIIGNAAAQGATLGDLKATQRVLGYNYTQIFRHGFSFTNTQTSIELYGGREPAKEAAKKAVEHKRSIEYSLFWGARKFDTTGTSPRGYMGGAFEYISTNVKNESGSTLTQSELDKHLIDLCQHGSKNKMLFVSPVVAYNLSQMAMNTTAFNFNQSDSNSGPVRMGVAVDGFVTGAYGYGIPVVVKRDWNDFGTTSGVGYGGWAFLIDMDYVQLRPLRERSTKLLRNRQANDADVTTHEYLTEVSLMFKQEKVHGLIKGVTSA